MRELIGRAWEECAPSGRPPSSGALRRPRTKKERRRTTVFLFSLWQPRRQTTHDDQAATNLVVSPALCSGSGRPAILRLRASTDTSHTSYDMTIYFQGNKDEWDAFNARFWRLWCLLPHKKGSPPPRDPLSPILRLYPGSPPQGLWYKRTFEARPSFPQD